MVEECLVASVAGSFMSWARLVDAVKTDSRLQDVMWLVDRGSDERTEWLSVRLLSIQGFLGIVSASTAV